METVMRFIQRVALATGLICLIFGIALLLQGCTMARGPGGEVIIGVPVGTLVETTNQAIITGAGMIPVVGPFIQNLLLGAGASGLTVAGVAKAGRLALEKRRKQADIAREKAERRVAELEATLAERMNVDA